MATHATATWALHQGSATRSGAKSQPAPWLAATMVRKPSATAVPRLDRQADAKLDKGLPGCPRNRRRRQRPYRNEVAGTSARRSNWAANRPTMTLASIWSTPREHGHIGQCGSRSSFHLCSPCIRVVVFDHYRRLFFRRGIGGRRAQTGVRQRLAPLRD